MSDTSTSPAGAPAGLFDLYTKLRSSGLSDEDAALALAKQGRASADSRSGWRRVSDIMDGTNTSDAYRAELMQEADKPLADLAERGKAGPFAAEETGRQAGAMGQDIALRQQVGLLDPAHPANRALQSIIGSADSSIPPEALSKITVAQYPGLKDALGQYIEMKKPTIQPPAVVAKTGAETAKIAAETRAIPTEVAQKAAQTAKTGAETKQIQMETSGTVAPGWVVNGTQAVKQSDRDAHKAQVAAVAESSALIDKILDLTKGSDFIASPEKLARLGSYANQLLLSSKSSAGIKGLPSQDVQFLQGMTGNFSPFNPSNLLGLTHNKERLNTLKQILNQNLESDAAAHGISRAPVAGSATHYLISPDRKFRIPADANGKPLGPQEANPNG